MVIDFLFVFYYTCCSYLTLTIIYVSSMEYWKEVCC